jgi:DNA-nicking Smr family endonuclease
MKKREKPTATPKQKEFAVSPFKALKGVTVGLPEKPEKAEKAEKAGKTKAAQPPAPKKPAQSQQEVDDALLFFDAVADVRRLEPVQAAAAKDKTKPQARAASERDEEERRVFMKAIESLKMDVRFRDELPEEEVPPRPAAVNRLRQLRRGAIRLDLELDLHGLTRDEAVESLEHFVKGAYNRGQKGVLVITGKGNNSEGEPVLKSAVTSWLRVAGKNMVSEFLLAPKDMGGSGAIVVFLKEKKPAEPAAEKKEGSNSV